MASAQVLRDFIAGSSSKVAEFRGKTYLDLLNVEAVLVEEGEPECLESLRWFYQSGQKLELEVIKSYHLSMTDLWREYRNRFCRGHMSVVEPELCLYGATDNVFFLYYWSEPDKELSKRGIMDRVLSVKGFSNRASEMFRIPFNEQRPIIDEYLSASKFSRARFVGAHNERLVFNSDGASNIGVMYLASDPYTSRYYGNALLAITINPDAKVFPFHSPEWEWLNRRVINEIKERHPRLSQCTGRSFYNRRLLFRLALEDSGTDILSYFLSRGWFQILNSEKVTNIESISRESLGERSIEEVDQALKKGGLGKYIQAAPGDRRDYFQFF